MFTLLFSTQTLMQTLFFLVPMLKKCWIIKWRVEQKHWSDSPLSKSVLQSWWQFCHITVKCILGKDDCVVLQFDKCCFWHSISLIVYLFYLKHFKTYNKLHHSKSTCVCACITVVICVWDIACLIKWNIWLCLYMCVCAGGVWLATDGKS